MCEMKISSSIICFLGLIIISFADDSKYNRTFAGAKTLSECVRGLQTNSPLDITTTEMIRKEGYATEEHVVLTKDGYLLTMNRIPGPKNAPTVLLQHGLIFSSFDWVANGKDKSLAFYLADNGYDVWIGNFRGTIYSKCHVKYTTSENKYWNFSFHEMGIYDLPAEINYITEMKKDKLVYVGHSMGTTSFYVMAIERPDVASKVKAMYSLAPVAYTYNMKGAVMVLTSYMSIIYYILYHFNAGEVFSQNRWWKLFVDVSCRIISNKICGFFVFPIAGFDAPQLNYTLIPLYYHHFPAGAAAKTFAHYAQGAVRNTFKYYDYGEKGNLKMYNSAVPPDYNLSKIQVPIGLFVSENDYLSHVTDAERLYKALPKKILFYKVPNRKFNHFDYLWAIDARKLVYDKLLSEINKYR